MQVNRNRQKKKNTGRVVHALFLLLCMLALQGKAQRIQNGTKLFDENWLFFRGDTTGAESPSFNDRNWRLLDLPHDWSIEDLPGTSSPFQATAVSGVSGGFTTGGTGWYRKKFRLPAGNSDKHYYIRFDGIYMNADVWLNGHRLGNHPYGYTSFWYDITGQVQPGKENLLAVRVKNEGRNSRWYAGSGIYRHVWLSTTDAVHVTPWGVAVTTPLVNAAAAQVRVETAVRNETTQQQLLQLVTRIIDASGKEQGSVATTQQIQPRATFTCKQQFTLASPRYWSVEKPVLYKAVTRVYCNGRLTDSITTLFGVRTLAYNATQGFLLNGEPVKLKGGCVHHDNGPLGAKALDRAEERKVALLKEAGYNAVRCAHNPPSPAFLDACDRLGMLVIDEAFDMWKDKKNRDDYHLYFDDWWQKDLAGMLYRDRNHPSVIMWSIGNEIPNRDKPEVAAKARQLAGYVRSIDSTRPVTCGVNGIAPDKDAFIAALDIAGYNYARDKYEPDHQRLPQRVMFASESFPLEAFDYWTAVEAHPWVIGDFVWTAFDYIGEASIGWLGYPQNKDFYPWNLAYCGDIDICGWKRPQSFYRDALWKSNQLAVFVRPPVPSFPRTNPKLADWSRWNWADVVADWTWPGFEQQPLEVTVYSSCEETELLLNGRSLGRKPTGRDTKYMAVWQVPYAAGELKAVGYTNGQQVNTAILHTAGAPAGLQLYADRRQLQANGQDLSYVTIQVTDAAGHPHPKAAQLLHFSLEGPAKIVAVGNANPESTESFVQPQRFTWRGKCLVVVQAGKKKGPVLLRVTGKGLQPAVIKLSVK
jgi:beta-galactosidase